MGPKSPPSLDLTPSLENYNAIASRVKEMEVVAAEREPNFAFPENPLRVKLSPRQPGSGTSTRRASPRTKRARPAKVPAARGPAKWGELWGEHGYPMPPPAAAAHHAPRRASQVGQRRRASADTGRRGSGRGNHHAKRNKFLRAIASKETLRELAKLTSFSEHELEGMRREFLEVAVSKTLGPDMFQRFMLERYPTLRAHSHLITRLFNHFDANHDGVVNFDEFILGLSKTVSCDVNTKVDMLFACLDLSDDKNVSVSELMMFFNDNAEDMQEHFRFAKDFISTLDTDKSGAVSVQEFGTALRDNKMLLHCFEKMLPFPSMSEGPVRELAALNGSEPGLEDGEGDDGGASGCAELPGEEQSFDFENLKKLWHDVVRGTDADADADAASPAGGPPRQRLSSGLNETELDRPHFTRMMVRYFGCKSVKQLELCDSIFDSFDEDGSGRISLGEMLRGLTVLLAPTPEQLVAFYFRLFDRDNNGKIDEAELSHMLEATCSSVADACVSARELLRSGDTDESGHITLDEFRGLTKTNPELLDLVSRCMRG